MTPRKPTRARALGVSDAEYARLLEAQGGTCALCSNVPKRLKKDGTPYRLHADHDHATKRVRGLLCWKCNDALPTWVTAAWLRKAADYVEGPLVKVPPGLPPLATIGGKAGQLKLYAETPKRRNA